MSNYSDCHDTERDRSLLSGDATAASDADCADEFVGRIQTQQAEGYQLAFPRSGVTPSSSVAGFRVQTLLWSGKTLYVDDLVTDEGARSKGLRRVHADVADCAGEGSGMHDLHARLGNASA